jgi:hypothetical protein
MRKYRALVWILLALSPWLFAQQPAAKDKDKDDKDKVSGSKPSAAAAPESGLKEMFEARIKDEWEALKRKDKKAYGDLLADDFEGVEVDGKGERNKIQAINEVVEGNVFNYTLWGYKMIPLGPDAAFVIYEVTMEFPPKSQVRYSRVYISELWVKHGGQWKELHYQETHVK